MKKIYKYPLKTSGGVTVINNKIIEFLDIQMQDGIPTLWALVDTETETKTNILFIGTGWTLADEVDKYIGTVQDDYGFVWHYFAARALPVYELDGLFDACM